MLFTLHNTYTTSAAGGGLRRCAMLDTDTGALYVISVLDDGDCMVRRYADVTCPDEATMVARYLNGIEEGTAAVCEDIQDRLCATI